MECLHGRISYASWRLRVFRRLFHVVPDLNGPITVSRRALTSSTRSPSHHQQSPEESNQDERPKPKVDSRKSDQETPLRPSQLLPQSPFRTTIHPGLAKKRKKRLPTPDDLNDLHKNPWAVALASPIRMCAATNARVPRALLSEWGMVERPESEGLWFMPVGLLKDELASEAARKEAESAPASTPKHSSSVNQRLRHLTLRLVNRLPLLRSLTKMNGPPGLGRKLPIARLIPYRWKHPFGPVTAREEKQIIWREDIPEFVLSRMRIEVLKQLKLASDKYKRSEAPNGVWKTIDLKEYSEAGLLEGVNGLEPFKRMECGAVLVVGPLNEDKAVATAPDSKNETTIHDLGTLPEFVMLEQVQSKVPVFEFARLFSKEELEELWGHDSRFQSPALFLRPDDKITVDAMLALWKLKGFVRHDPIYENPDDSN
ncbi:hypothetical protein BBP40_009114 [Aspergillus hancockii]|nr:hypothetical protein BBP40_009114 [Aspergillus hancockii]